MPRKPKAGNGWFAYLEQNGLLGADETTMAIARKKYHTLWKRQWRKVQKESGTVYYKPRFSNEENKRLIYAAKNYGTSPTNFIRTITLCHIDNTPILPNIEAFRKIMQLLGLIHNHLTETPFVNISPDEIDTLKLRLIVLEDTILHLYHNPPHLLEHIEQTLKRNPDLLPALRKLLL
ncbi:MAG: hypothetical protein ACO1PI_10200 [Bacteroidota bacterium]